MAAHLRTQQGALPGRGAARAAGTVTAARPVLARLQAFELVAGAYVARTHPAHLNGEHREPVTASRIGDALAAWDVHAHRALAADPSPAHLRLVALTQELLTRHSTQILHAAATTGAIDPHQYATRLARPLEASRAAWAATAATWDQLAGHAARPTASTIAAATAAMEVRACLRGITVDGSAPSTPAVIATRTDLPAATRHLATALSCSVDLAHAVRDVTADDRLAAPARAVNAVAVAASTTRTGGTVPGAPQESVVAIRDLTSNAAVPLPHIVRARVVNDADLLIGATGCASAAGTWLQSGPATPTSTAPPMQRPPEPARLRGRHVAAGSGCER